MEPTRHFVLRTGALALFSIALSGHEQLSVEGATITHGKHRMVFPAKALIDSARAERVLATVTSATPVRGVPPRVLAGSSIVVSLATDISQDVDAVSYPDQRVIALPSRAWHKWPAEKLERVVRHEVGHLALGAYLGGADVPRWLSEGFAEWSAGGLSCEDETMLRLDLLTRNTRIAGLLSSESTIARSRLEYAYFVTFIEFLDLGNAVSSGRLLTEVRRFGASNALVGVFRANVKTLEARWWATGLERYRGGLTAQMQCSP
jgi:hypothetical protein